MSFLILSGRNIDFLSRELNEKALLTTRRIELVGKKKFAAAELDLEHETYVV